MVPRAVRIAAFGLLLALSPLPSRAGTFAVCHVDTVDLTLCDDCDLTLSKSGFAIFVNKCDASVGAAEFFGMTFSVRSSSSDLVLEPFVTDPGLQIAPIRPNEAVGNTVHPGAGLTSRLEPGETFRNTAPVPLFGFRVTRRGPYEGLVTCDVTMQVGSEVASFPMSFWFRRGPNAIAFRDASRATSSPGSVPATRSGSQTTWGRLKVLYQ